VTPQKLERFARAFSSNSGFCRFQCECGAEFYTTQDCIDWKEGEFEALEEGKASPMDYMVGTLCFEGKQFVWDCTCWHARATQIMTFIHHHRFAIADFLNGEKEAATNAAAAEPGVHP